MSKRRFKKTLEIGILLFKDPYYQEFAAQLAFYLLMSIVPIIAITSYALGFFNITQDFFQNVINQYVAPEMAKYIDMFLKEGPTMGVNITLIVIAIWSASKAQFAMSRITNYTMTGGKTTGGYFYERARALITILLFIASIIFALVVLVYGQSIMKVLFLFRVSESNIDQIWFVIRWPLALLLYFFIIAMNYYLLPQEKVPLRDIVPGAVLASAGFLLVSYGYSIYMRYISNQSVLYGSFATIVGLMLWFWLISWVIWLGILLNKCMIDSKEYK